MNIKTTHILCFSEVFPDEEPKDLNYYLSEISRKTIIQFSSFLIESAQNKSYENVLILVDKWFKFDNKIRDRICSQLVHFQSACELPVSILNNYSSLLLFEYVYQNSIDDGNEDLYEQFALKVFQAYLLINQITTEREEPIENQLKKYNSNFQIPLLLISLMFHRTSLEYFNMFEVAYPQIVKSAYLFDFLKRNEETKTLLNSFMKEFNLKNDKEYFGNLIHINKLLIQSEKNGVFSLYTEYQYQNEFLELLTIEHANFSEVTGFSHIKSQPFYKKSENEYVAIYKPFVAELLYKALYFKLHAVNKKYKHKNAFKEYLGLHFSEQYLIYSFLNSIFGEHLKKITGKQFEDNGIEGMPDYYIRNGNKIFLFEAKDTLIKADVVDSYNVDLIYNELKKKLYENERGRPKGITQLINSVAKILKGDNTLDNISKLNRLKFFPVIITHNRTLNVPGLNHILYEWMSEKLNLMNIENQVFPPVLINIDDLINYEPLFVNKQFKFESLISEYIKESFSKPSKNLKSADLMLYQINKTMMSFHHFISNKAAGKTIDKKKLIQRLFVLLSE